MSVSGFCWPQVCPEQNGQAERLGAGEAEAVAERTAISHERNTASILRTLFEQVTIDPSQSADKESRRAFLKKSTTATAALGAIGSLELAAENTRPQAVHGRAEKSTAVVEIKSVLDHEVSIIEESLRDGEERAV